MPQSDDMPRVCCYDMFAEQNCQWDNGAVISNYSQGIRVIQ